jgi:restriction system protein
MPNARNAWVLRAGRYGEREQWCLAHGWAGGGWDEVPDLTDVTTRQAVADVMDKTYADEKPGMRSNATGQLWRLRHEIQLGDLVAMPLKHAAQIALGVVVGGYQYLIEEESSKRHVLRVDWRRQDLPRTAVKQDLLHSLGGAMTIFGVTRHDGAARLWHLLEQGIDPGSHSSIGAPKPVKASAATAATPVSGEEEAESAFDLERYAQDQIARWITENFAGHKLQDLVAAVLGAHGYVVETPSKGTDGGVDVTAGRGPLGLDPPRIIGQVKSEPSPVGSPVVQQLQGAMSAHGADQGLLVALGGLTPPARQALTHQKFSIRVWDSDDLIEAVLEVYDKLPEATRSELPLRRTWTLVTDTDS